MVVSCKNCGGTDIDHDPARGDSVCISCGSVVESLCIVSDVLFQENSAGNASVIGQFVSADGGQSGGSYKYASGRDHRQVILDNGRRNINVLGSQLKMTHHCLDSAFMFYKMAVNKRFTSGRRTVQVIGACLYLVSRTEKTPHMLLDICDVVQCDVVTLGRVFLQLARELCIDCPIVDPSLYIHRFAHQLDFGDKENGVSMTALRIMARMKKDWIHFGRRPSALCGAALIIAGKFYNFDVTMKDIVKLVRMSKTTVFKRLMDFSKTATGKLTTDEFKRVDLEEEADPPCYTDGRNRVKFAQEINGKYKFVSTDILAQVTKTQEKLEELLDKRKSIKVDIEGTKSESKTFDYRKELPVDYSLYNYELDENGEFKKPNHIIHKDELDGGINNDEQIENEDFTFSTSKTLNENKMADTVASSTLLLDQSMIKKCENEDFVTEDIKGTIESEEVDLDGIDDSEIDQLLLTEEEIKIKTEIWLEENRDYLIKMKEKEEEQRRKEEEENKNGVKKKKRTYKRKPRDRPACGTADEAIKTMLAERKLSSKINYDVLRGLKSEDHSDDVTNIDNTNIVKKENLSKDEPSETLNPNNNDEVQINEMPVVYEEGPTDNAVKKTIKKTLKRLANGSGPVLGGSIETKKMKVEKNEETQTAEKVERVNPADMEVVVESGAPVFENEVVDYEDCYDDEDDRIVSTSSLFAKTMDDDDYGYGEEDSFY